MAVPDPLLTDLYELAMAAALVAEGAAETPAVFSLFVRQAPASRGYLVAAGLDDVLVYLESLRFTDEDLATLRRLVPFEPAFLDWLAELRFTGTVRAIPEGRIVFPNEPLLEIAAPFGVAQLLETWLLNQITLQTVLATKAARCRHAAGGRTLVDFSLRRAHGTDAGMKVARASAMVGFAATSNVAAALRYGLAVSGTMAHSYVTAHPSELDAFRSFARHHFDDPVLLVDTYDTAGGIDHAIEVGRELAAAGTGKRLAAVRLDSGDLEELSRLARGRLDAAGLRDVKVFASGGLAEDEIAALVEAGAPIDGFGVGTRLGVSEDAPSLDTVYKLVEVDGRPVAKFSPGKETLPGAKQVWRRDGFAGDILGLRDQNAPEPGAEPLLAELPPKPAANPAMALGEARERFEIDWVALPEEYKRLEKPARYPVDISPELRALTTGGGGAPA
jgi:nicotinate phosphoribosyltransferase